MAINLITEYQKKIAERFTLGSLTDEAAGPRPWRRCRPPAR